MKHILISFLTLFFFCSARSSDPVCSICGARITSDYFKYTLSGSGEEIIVCADCQTKAIKCSICGIPLGKQVFNLDDRQYCSQCFYKVLSRPVCGLCNKRIPGNYTTYTAAGRDILHVCESCESLYAKCDCCGRPALYTEIIDSKTLCRNCASTVIRCKACGAVLLDKIYRYNIYNYTYCSDCEKNLPRCAVCNLPAGKGSRTLSDGRIACTDCGATAVGSIDAVIKIYQLIKGFLYAGYGMKIREVAGIEFCSLEKMRLLASDVSTYDNRSVPQGLFRKDNDSVKILVQPELPRNLLVGVIAHEYANQ
ncbi:MAG: hypothetical protein PHQ23_06440 [Candidatus Wallbacteria bacterium]|nr:hypothetical protein [Candidatus Wallbacteria bacterium]